MPVLKKEIELNNGTKVWVRQASGMDKLKIEKLQAVALRKCRHFGPNPSEWTDEQQEEFAVHLDEAGAGIDSQIQEWVPKCILTESVDAEMLTSEELMTLLRFVRGDDAEGAVPLV
tara:strand:- start:17024 stop:17371 length:348 start_codon:yes stop_codon:yes gene_type:complete